MGKLASISASQMLRDYSQGAAQSASSRVANFIAPGVSVGTSVGRFKKYTAKNRFRIPKTARSLGGGATQIGFTAEDKNFNCEPHALDFPVDLLEKIESEGLENVVQEGADIIASIGALAHEKRVVDKAIETVGAGTALAIGANDDVVDQLDGDILDVIKAARFGALMGVGVLFGASAWRKVKNHASVRNRFVAGGKKEFAVPSVKEFGKLLISDCDCEVSLMCYDDAAEGLEEDINFVLDGDILIFARSENPTRFDPSFMKTFRLRGQWMVPGSYMTPDGRAEVAKFDWSEDVQVTNETAAKRRTVA
jgi:hypothetical protein